MNVEEFSRLLSSGVIVSDGGIGTMLFAAGAPPDASVSHVCVSSPEMVLNVHRAYVDAGAQLLKSNTFDANLAKLGRYGLSHAAYEVNERAVALAKRVAEGRTVAGVVGPSGHAVLPGSDFPFDDVFRRQIEGLVAGGADVLLVETQVYLTEARSISSVARSVAPDVALLLSFSLGEDGVTPGGATVRDIAKLGEELGVAAVGFNHGVGLSAYLDSLEELRSLTSVPVLVMPNAGVPSFADGRVVFSDEPDYFGRFASLYVAAGASIVGGCCGTTPRHIRAAIAAIAETVSVPVRSVESVGEPAVAPRKWVEGPTRLERRLASGNLALMAELRPPTGPSCEREVRTARDFVAAGFDFLTVADSPMGRVRASPLAFARLVSDTLGVETVVHFTVRDRNLPRIQSDLLGANLLGLRNVLALAGDPPALGDYPHASAVMDVSTDGLLRLMSFLNRGVDLAGNALGGKTGFFVGAALNPTAEDAGAQVERAHRKVEEGAAFFITQPVFDAEAVERFLDTLKLDTPVVIGVLPPKSRRQAEYFANEVPGIRLPSAFLKRLAGLDKKDVFDFSVESLVAVAERLRPRIGGVYLVPTVNDAARYAPFVRLCK